MGPKEPSLDHKSREAGLSTFTKNRVNQFCWKRFSLVGYAWGVDVDKSGKRTNFFNEICSGTLSTPIWFEAGGNSRNITNCQTCKNSKFHLRYDTKKSPNISPKGALIIYHMVMQVFPINNWTETDEDLDHFLYV